MSKFESYFFEKESDSIEKLIQSTGSQLSKETVESIVALINKTVSDWNREKQADGKEIEKIIVNGIKSKVINFE